MTAPTDRRPQSYVIVTNARAALLSGEIAVRDETFCGDTDH
jgi:hypothetical protein